MQNALTNPDLFKPYEDPKTGVTSFVLRKRVAPVQEAFYFVNTSLSDDSRWLWFYCAHPPAGDATAGRTLGVLNTVNGEMKEHRQTAFVDASPWIDPHTGRAYWCTRRDIWRLAPDGVEGPQLVGRLPDDLIGERYVRRLATHLTPTCDGRAFLLDVETSSGWFVGMMDRTSGAFELWQRFDTCFNHGQCSPTDPDQVLLARDFWIDPATGTRRSIHGDRIWLCRRGETARRLFDQPTLGTHEWWDADGHHVWYIDGGKGTCRVNIHTRRVELVWPSGRWHSHVDPSGRFLVGDNALERPFRRGVASRVSFFNRVSGRETDIITRNPPASLHTADYHIDPHPRFTHDGKYVLHTTTVLGGVDLAVTPVQSLIACTQ